MKLPNLEPQTGVFAVVDGWLKLNNPGEASRALQRIEGIVRETFTLPLLTRWIAIDHRRKEWGKVCDQSARFCELAPDSPLCAQVLDFWSSALRQLGQDGSADHLLSTGASHMLDLALNCATAGDQAKAKALLTVAIKLHPTAEMFASTNPTCRKILEQPANN